MPLTRNPHFLSSRLHRELRARPLGHVDIGARGGAQAYAAAAAELTAILAFEPDAAAVPALEAALGREWALAAVEPIALGGAAGTAALHLFAHGVNHSLLPAAPAFRERYRVASLADRGETVVPVDTLDAILFGRRADQPFWGELLKLDAQGAELEILRAAPRTLAERTVAIVAEISFLDIYQGQPRFSDLERFLAGRGFTFYGFLALQGWSRKFLDKRRTRGRERLCFGDAVFLRDPLPSGEGGGPLTPRRRDMLYLCALLFGFHDFAIELAVDGGFPAGEAAGLVALAQDRAAHPPEAALAEVAELLARMTAAPADAGLELGRFLDRHRTLADMSDAALPRAPVPPEQG